MKSFVTGKRRRPSSVSFSPLPQAARDDENNHLRWKRRRLESTPPDVTEAKPPKLCGPEAEEKKPTPRGKRRRSETPEEKEETQDETSNSCSSNDGKHRSKRCRVVDVNITSSPPPVLPATPLANLSEKHVQSPEQENRPCTTEEKARFPPSPIITNNLSQLVDNEDALIEKRENVATYTSLEDLIVSSQGSDVDLVAACANLNDVVSCSQDSLGSDVERVQARTSLRTVQVTPPPSARMLDRKNPPPPPKRPKRRHNYGIIYARAYPRLALSPLIDNSPPSSPRVFRSLENEFAFAMQDTPEIRPRVRPAPRMARGTRRSTRAGMGARRSLDTPTSTMVLRSRQLNPSSSADGGKPENQREREQRDAQRRQK